MESNLESLGLSLPTPTVKARAEAASSLHFDWMMVVVSIWWLGGLFIDGWAHSNIPQLETFFTPWHAVFYSGYLAVATTLVVKIIQNLRQIAIEEQGSAPGLVTLIRQSLPGNRWTKAIPNGYGLAVLGLVIFLFSGIGDMTWHIIFGIERSTEALLSPTHLGLALGIGLSLSAPLRAAWRRSGKVVSWRQLGPAIFSLTFTFCLLTFMAAYAAPLVTPWPLFNTKGSAGSGITAILMSTGVMMGFVLLAIRRWRLPFGTFAFILGVNGAMMAVFSPRAIVISLPTALLAGIAVDFVYRSLQPTEDQPASVRLFAFLVPAILYLFYFIDLAITGPLVYNSGILWSTPFWAGTPVIAGIAGFLLSFVMIPPAYAAQEQE